MCSDLLAVTRSTAFINRSAAGFSPRCSSNIAAVRKINLESVESRVEGDIDLRGILGLSGEVRNGFSQIRVSFRVRGDASPDQLRQLVEQAVARSAVYDVLTNGVPISVDVATS